jgi:putative flippase GtrA
VDRLRDLYRQFRHLIHEGAAFLVVGSLAFLIVLVGSGLLRYDAGLGKYTAVTVATAVATAFSFAGNRLWTFRHREGAGTAREAAVFFALNGVGLLIQYACIWIVTSPLGRTGKLWYELALVAGVGLGTLFRFWSYRRWVWVLPADAAPGQGRAGRHRKGTPAPAPAAGRGVSTPS